ncbi:MBL fold metallo-hydrolase [Nannocystis pusilla]|uniref:MBL fold metallo-hydrolase n=1 Tax=Nannocystis pusilla TaxID=889268 RepID=UPI003B78C13C
MRTFLHAVARVGRSARAARRRTRLAPPPSGPGFHFIDVGQGSALLLVGSEGHAVLIDAGPPPASEPILAALTAHDLAAVDLWIFSHFDNDHIGGFARALAGPDNLADTDDDLELRERWDRGTGGMPETPPRSPTPRPALLAPPRVPTIAGTRQASRSASSLRVRRRSARPKTSAVWPCASRSKAPRFSLQAISRSFRSRPLRACGAVDVLWTSHHGSRTGISQAVLAAAAPALVVISAGGDNSTVTRTSRP